MSFPVQSKDRVSRSGYWLAMLINVVACIVLVVGGVFAILDGSFLFGGILLLGALGVGIYFRVVMVRRCRDIGWPPMLPWGLFGAVIVANIIDFSGADSADAITSFGLAGMIGLVDFAVMIVIGFLPSKNGYDFTEVFEGAATPAQRPSPMGAPAAVPQQMGARDHQPEDGEGAEHASWDAAIQRALDKQAAGGVMAQGSNSQPQPMAQAPAAPPPPRAAGFGRKGL